MNHDQLSDLLTSYVFGGLTAEERLAVNRHLDTGCVECLQELRDLNETAAELARSLPIAASPSHIKDRIMKTLHESSARKMEPKNSVAWLPWSIAVAAVLALAVVGFNQVELWKRNSELQRRLTEAQDVTALLSAPSMQFVNLAGVGPNEQAFGKVVLDPKRGAAVVYMYRLPQQPEGKEYQLWVMRDGKPTSAGLFRVSDDGGAALVLESLPNVDSIPKFWVTIEPEGGQPLPTGMMYLTSPR